jgi:hypothetical protein
VISLFTELEGSAFVVLRLLRLTRIFRALKNPKINEPVAVIKTTMMNSTKALYLLGFNGLLGVLIAGSLMYLVEGKGEWDKEQRWYTRVSDATMTGSEWNAATAQWEELPRIQTGFPSIPDAFWWAASTFTTVGYGDSSPSTSGGYTIAVMYMVFSLVIVALPVGILGEEFTRVWEVFNEKKRLDAYDLSEDHKFITAAIQRIQPFVMSKYLYVEVWNERLTTQDGDTSTLSIADPTDPTRPGDAEFLGRAVFEMNLEQDRASGQLLHGKLYDMSEEDHQDDCGGGQETCNRHITGHIYLHYEWTPEAPAKKSQVVGTRPSEGDTAPAGPESFMEKRPTLKELLNEPDYLHGKLQVTLEKAEGLMNLIYMGGKKCGSNPYCRVFCYPRSPTSKGTLCPEAWRSPMVVGNVSPKWDAVHTFDFAWEQESAEEPPPVEPPAPVKDSSTDRSEGTFAGPPPKGKVEVSQLVQSLGNDLNSLRDEIQALNNRVARFSGE